MKIRIENGKIYVTPAAALALAQEMRLTATPACRCARAIAWAMYDAACMVENTLQPPHRPAIRPCVEHDRYMERIEALRAGQPGKPFPVRLDRGGTARAMGVPGDEGSCVEITLHADDFGDLVRAIDQL